VICSGRWGRLAIGIALSLWLLYLMFRHVDWRSLDNSAFSVNPALIVIAILVLCFDYFLRLLRWHWMLRLAGSSIGLNDCARPFFIGFALNNLLPLRAGDIARVVSFGEVIGISGARILGTLVTERLFDLLVLLAMLGTSLSLVPQGGDSLAWVGPIWTTAGVGLIGLGSGSLALVTIPGVSIGLSWVLMHLLEEKRGQQVMHRIEQLRSTLVLLGNPRALGGFVALSIAAWVLEGFVVALVVLALERDTSGVWLAVAAGNLGTLLPGAPGHFGTFDFFAMQGLMAFNTDQNAAAFTVVFVHLMLWLPVTFVGLILIRVAPNQSKKKTDEHRQKS
jgi:uncharacterized membrane protein YbhN (UPF0104 family)